MNKFQWICLILFTLLNIFIFRLIQNPTVATFGYIVVSYLRNFDAGQKTIVNYNGEVEDGIFTHRFIPINQTFRGLPVEATYHIVECGSVNSEAVVLGHGLGENWRVWKKIMIPFCDTHRLIAFDTEGMGKKSYKLFPN